MLIGYVDYVTGIEIRVFPMYFLPIVFAARLFRQWGALATSLLAVIIWEVSLYLGGREYSSDHVWIINFFTQGAAFVVVGLLVARIQTSLKREQDLSRIDALTGLLSRRAFHEQSEVALRLCHRHRRPLTLVYIDLDNFKQINDTLGHKTGDSVLISTAQKFRTALRSSDLVGRLGGDEFAVLLPETHAEEAQNILNKVRKTLLDNPLPGIPHVTASMGAVTYAVAPAELSVSLQAADALMYEVKKTGKNNIVLRSL